MKTNKLLSSVLCAILLSTYTVAAPAGSSSSSEVEPAVSSSSVGGSSTASAPPPSSTVPLASDDPNAIAWNVTTDIIPEPIRGSLGATLLGPQNVQIDRQNPDLLAPPTTDAGSM